MPTDHHPHDRVPHLL